MAVRSAESLDIVRSPFGNRWFDRDRFGGWPVGYAATGAPIQLGVLFVGVLGAFWLWEAASPGAALTWSAVLLLFMLPASNLPRYRTHMRRPEWHIRRDSDAVMEESPGGQRTHPVASIGPVTLHERPAGTDPRFGIVFEVYARSEDDTLVFAWFSEREDADKLAAWLREFLGQPGTSTHSKGKK